MDYKNNEMGFVDKLVENLKKEFNAQRMREGPGYVEVILPSLRYQGKVYHKRWVWWLNEQGDGVKQIEYMMACPVPEYGELMFLHFVTNANLEMEEYKFMLMKHRDSYMVGMVNMYPEHNRDPVRMARVAKRMEKILTAELRRYSKTLKKYARDKGR